MLAECQAMHGEWEAGENHFIFLQFNYKKIGENLEIENAMIFFTINQLHAHLSSQSSCVQFRKLC